MQKIKVMFQKNYKVLIGIVIGGLVFGSFVYASNTFKSSDVTYNNKISGLTSTNMQGAIDELNTKVNNMVPIDPDTFNTNTAKTIYASSKGICIKRNNKLNCFKINNWDVEKDHIQQVFSDTSCNVGSSAVSCYDSNFYCNVGPSGSVGCLNGSDNSSCGVSSDGSVNCN